MVGYELREQAHTLGHGVGGQDVPPGHSALVQTVLLSAECPPTTLCRAHKGKVSPSLAGAITTKQITAHTM